MSSLRVIPIRSMHVSPERASISVWMKFGRCSLMVLQVLFHLAAGHLRQLGRGI